VLIDFAHNASWVYKVLRSTQSVDNKKDLIIAGIGDRRDEDIVNVLLLRECLIISLFDKKKYLRGRTEEEIINQY
jgi:UDP-N-acetylmuramyl tripeptide synthase